MSKNVSSPAQRVWLMGLANSTYGFGYAAVLVTAPQLLAAHGVAEPVIAGMTTLALSSSLLVFVVAPVFDTLISRRAWSIGLGLAGAALTTLVLTLPATSHLLGAALAIAALILSLYSSAIGGWLGAVLPKSSDETIGTWFTIGNASGFGLGALTQYWLVTHTPAGLGAVSVGVATLIPLAVLRVVPASDVGPKAVHESFRTLARDVVQLVRQPLILRLILMFILPCAAFTLTNAFGGMGPDFHAGNNLVSIANGIGAVVTGVLASILARLILKWISAPCLYLAIGSLGAAFTLVLLRVDTQPRHLSSGRPGRKCLSGSGPGGAERHHFPIHPARQPARFQPVRPVGDGFYGALCLHARA